MDMYNCLGAYLSAEEITCLKDEMEKGQVNKGFVFNTARLKEEILFSAFKSLKKDGEIPNLFRYDPSIDAPGKSVFHEGGAFYIMDPSAAEAVSHLGFNQKGFVLDMCAAPGGKTIAYALNNPESLIIANDISSPRAGELSKNVERLGLANVIVTSFPPEILLKKFPEAFDTVILDAPCSGTGMFRKEEKMKEDWSMEKVQALLPIQKDLLKEAEAFLKPGGRLLYLTCSFLKEEDEDQVASILNNCPSLSLCHLTMKDSYRQGTIENTVHLLPTLFKGEGHFFALLQKAGNKNNDVLPVFSKAKYDSGLRLYTFSYRGESWGLPYLNATLMDLYALRFGLKLTNHAEYAKAEADHALSHYPHSARQQELSEEEAKRFLSGEEFKARPDQEDGLYIASYMGLGLGYLLKKGSRMHNLYPKGLRKNIL